jgi:hypothetical protein
LFQRKSPNENTKHAPPQSFEYTGVMSLLKVLKKETERGKGSLTLKSHHLAPILIKTKEKWVGGRGELIEQ